MGVFPKNGEKYVTKRANCNIKLKKRGVFLIFNFIFAPKK